MNPCYWLVAHRQRKYFHLEITYLMNHGWMLYGPPFCDPDGYLCQALVFENPMDGGVDPSKEGWRLYYSTEAADNSKVAKPDAVPYDEKAKDHYNRMREESQKAP